MIEADTYNEQALLRQMTNGDQQAFQAIYYYYAPRIYGKLLKVLHSEDLATELLQEIFVVVWQKRAYFDAEKSFRSYLFKMADNLVIDLFRKTQRNKLVMDKLLAASIDQYTHTEEWLLQKEHRAILKKAIDQLPPQQKLVFTLCKLEHKSHEEVAGLLGLSTSTVNNHIVKATRSLREYLSSYPDLAGAWLVCFLLMQ